MRPACLALFLIQAGCLSGISLDPEGQYRCVPQSTTARSLEGCPQGLFCGADRSCHRADAGGDYACLGDFGCGGEFRCGPLGRCIDPREDALRADAGQVELSAVATVQSKVPWAAVSSLGAGRTFLGRSKQGQSIDVTPLAIAQGKDVYSAAVSAQGFAATDRLYLGKATLTDAILDVAAVRDEVYAITATRMYRYKWTVELDGGIPALVTPPSDPRVGDRLRVGNSAFPIVAELNPVTREYRLHDSAFAGDDTGAVPLTAPVATGKIDDMVDTDGRFLYASFNGVLHLALRQDALFATANPGNDVTWQTVGLVSAGREQLIGCGGGAVADKLTVRGIHVGDNPDLTQVERPLVALEVDVTRVDGGVLPTHWMRVDPDPVSSPCGAMPRHIARGFCPACGAGEQLRDLQWGRAVGLQPALRAECAGPDGGLSFYDLQTDSTGFSCQRERRTGGLPGAATTRQRSSATVRAAAVDNRIYFRREGLQPYVPLTIDQAPSAIERLDTGLVALGKQVVFRDTPQLGLALSSFADRSEPFPVAVASGSPWLIYDNGRVTDVDQLTRASLDTLAVPTRTDLKPPFAGARTITRDGRAFLVMSSFDAILVADLSDGGTAAPLEVRVVPETQVAIRSLVTLPPTDDAFVTGYALTENRLFFVTAASQAQWQARPVNVPEGDWAELWVDQRHARLGYHDGSAVSLPSGVRIAAPIMPSARVEDFAQHCGRSYALTSDTLYRLDHDGDPIGSWNTVELGALLGNQWKKLHVSRSGELWVLAGDGSGVALKGSPCAQ